MMEPEVDVLPQLKDVMLALVPTTGAIGNTSLESSWMAQIADSGLTLPPELDYWKIRNALIADGKVQKWRGRGGSVRRVQANSQSLAGSTLSTAAEYQYEQSLYQPFYKTIAEFYTKDYDIEDFVCEITANQGKKNTGGKWTRPDLTLVAVRMYPFIPGKTLEVVTFEVKPLNSYGIEGVYEAASHSSVANRAYLAVHVPESGTELDFMDRFERECDRFRIGLITFTDPADWVSFEVRVEAEHNSPDPAEVSAFIRTQIQPPNQRKIEKLVR